jgi:hypothetical protein
MLWAATLKNELHGADTDMYPTLIQGPSQLLYQDMGISEQKQKQLPNIYKRVGVAGHHR